MIELEKEKKYWLAFNVCQGIGPLRFKLLLDYFGSAEKAYRAKESELLKIGLGEKLVAKFENCRHNFDIDSYLLRVLKLGITPLTLEDKNYPELLKQIQNPPPVIYVKSISGSTGTSDIGEILNQKAVAVVGTRLPTIYGKKVTEIIVEGLVARGIVIVSGLARGIDAIAHRQTLVNQGLTIAVLGCGLDRMYPPEHNQLAQEIIKSGGALVSEFPLETEAAPGNFPARNRIISGLALGVVVTEAAKDSGSLITASQAAEQGREVFAVPGPITSAMSKGTAELIKKGAKLVTGVEDILEELNIRNRDRVRVLRPAQDKIRDRNRAAATVETTDDEKKVLVVLKDEDLEIDQIIRKSGLDSAKVGGLLSIMEIKGLIRSYNGVYSLGLIN
ncbi:MAG: hypothetical protein BWY24_00826 [Microgenomates group bacterium ADurb.Bin219]|nr:MAG: hypothetical protein BWY24_00826 [Microgenomates group bacterium ADurb.Bin219]HNP89266.1 DNA-processing protein DprA [Candidatus Woesebacteria bacterium]